jgi:uncharacterized membrane-anchored protein
MPFLPPDHPQRRAMADEVHARPPESMLTPARATHLAVLVDGGERGAEQQHLAACAGTSTSSRPRPMPPT